MQPILRLQSPLVCTPCPAAFCLRFPLCGQPKCTCGSFVSTFVCNCGHPWSDHCTEFVRVSYPKHGREWVVQGLSPDMAAVR